jgi:hypothetical protein
MVKRIQYSGHCLLLLFFIDWVSNYQITLSIRVITKLRKSVFDIYFTEFGADFTTVLPVLFKSCYKYCYSDNVSSELLFSTNTTEPCVNSNHIVTLIMSPPWVSGNYVATYVCDTMTSYVSTDAKRDTLSVPSNDIDGVNCYFVLIIYSKSWVLLGSSWCCLFVKYLYICTWFCSICRKQECWWHMVL